jgi:hypothetical protein
MTDFILSFEKDRVLIFDQKGKVLLVCYITGEHSLEREKRIVQLATQLYAECHEVDIGVVSVLDLNAPAGRMS